MASKQTYECYTCKMNGFPETRVYLDGKDENGKTIYKNLDMLPHRHNILITKQQEQSGGNIPAGQAPTETTDFQVRQESVDRGITAFSMMTALIRLVEQNQKELVTLNEKVEHLTKLVYAFIVVTITTKEMTRRIIHQDASILRKHWTPASFQSFAGWNTYFCIDSH
jgi:hypothetical protein